MTDSDSEPLDHLDDLASALIDGEIDRAVATDDLDDAARARLEDRVGEFSRLRDRVADLPDPPPDEVRDQMIARAVSVGVAASEPPAGASTGVVASVRPLDHHRARRAARLRHLAPVAAAAAVLLVGAIVLPSVLDGDGDDVALTAPDDGADATDTAFEAAAEDVSPAAPGAADTNAPGDRTEARAMEDDGAGLEAPAEVEGAPGIAVPSTGSADEADTFAFEEPSDEDLLDAVIRYRSTVAPSAPDPALQSLQAVCAGVIRHPIDLIVQGSYRSQAALFVADVDGSAVLAVTVLTPTCDILAQVSSN